MRRKLLAVTMFEDYTMQRPFGTIVSAALLATAAWGISGCSDTTGTKEETKISTPGGTATETHETKINKSGQNPPLAPSEKLP